MTIRQYSNVQATRKEGIDRIPIDRWIGTYGTLEGHQYNVVTDDRSPKMPFQKEALQSICQNGTFCTM